MQTVDGGTVNYSYDANGNTTGNTDNTFVYGENNRLKEAGIGGSPLASYTYNGRGERVKKLGATTTYYYYDQGGQLIAELDGSGNTVREYVYLDGQPLALITNNNIYTMHTDHLGTPQVITDAGQAIVWQADYEPFGKVNITTEAISNNLRFPGQYFDGETGLNYNYFRDYDPATGRYMESDPIGLNGGLDTYSYALNNPILYVDFDGLNPKKYEKPDNPNKKKTERSGTGTRKGDAGRERNQGHKNAEEHSRDNRGRSGGKIRGGGRLGSYLSLLPGLIEGYCAAGEIACSICQSFGYYYPWEGSPLDPCKQPECS